jgi:hypothetical protein
MTTRDEFPDLPHLLTVEEIARLLRLGRSTAYGYVNTYLDTGGLEGVPAIVVVGSSLRVPKWAVVEWLTTGVLPQIGAPRPHRSSRPRPA